MAGAARRGDRARGRHARPGRSWRTAWPPPLPALGCDLIVFVDVGGDALAHGDEPGLASPLCDALLLAAGGAPRRARSAARCSAASSASAATASSRRAEVLERLAEVGAAGGLAGARGLTARGRASASRRRWRWCPPRRALRRCAASTARSARRRSARGGGRVELSPAGALTFYFDPVAAVRSAARLAAAVTDARDLEHANEILHGLGVHTELDYERDALHTVR